MKNYNEVVLLYGQLEKGINEVDVEEHENSLEYDITIAKLETALNYADDHLTELVGEVIGLTKKIYGDAGIKAGWQLLNQPEQAVMEESATTC